MMRRYGFLSAAVLLASLLGLWLNVRGPALESAETPASPSGHEPASRPPELKTAKPAGLPANPGPSAPVQPEFSGQIPATASPQGPVPPLESQTKPANRRSGQAVTKRGNDPDEDDATVFIVSPPPAPGKGRTPLVGSPGHDQIDGSDDRDEIHGGNGDDVIGGRLADDWIDGESGDDVIDGDEGNDTLLGGDGDNFLHGGSGDDWLHANHGIDSLHGGPGADTLAGGGDGDTFVWLAGDASGGVDRIEDFNPDEGDTLHVADLLNSMGYQGDGSASSLEGFLRLNGTILEISQNNGEFTALVDLRIPQSINDLVAKGVLRATGRPPDRKE